MLPVALYLKFIQTVKTQIRKIMLKSITGNSTQANVRKAIEDVSGGAMMATRSGAKADGTVVIADIFPKRRGYKAFGFNHTGADAGTADQVVILGDTNGDIATGLSITATAYANAIGCGSNAALNRQLDDEPVVIDKISIEYGSLAQKAKQILYAVIHPDGQVEKIDITPMFRAQKSANVQQLLIQEAEFAGALKLGPNSGLLFYVGKDLELEAIVHPLVSKR